MGRLVKKYRHRLLCGDATDAKDVARAMDGEVPNLMVTDPPYGVNYDPEWREAATGFAAQRKGKVTNDDRVDWSEAWRLFPGDVAYVWHAGKYAAEVAQTLEGFEVRSHIVWRKATFALSRGHYHWMHEPCWYMVREGKTASWIGDRKQTTVWDVKQVGGFGGNEEGEDAAQAHGTQKPVECMARPVRNHDGDVYDPFVGSGTTIIACEQLERRCFAIDIDPAYVQVALERWQKFTGEEAVMEQ